MLVEMAGQNIRELSFQNVLDTILKPAGVKVGGYPEDIFLDLDEEEQEKWTCNICYLILKDARQCDNKHLFCHTCIFAWSMTYGENSQTCPVCRCEQGDRYVSNSQVDKRIGEKRVRCPEKACTFRSPMKIFLMHTHGRALYSNDGINLESLRPSRPPGSRLLVLPGTQDSPVDRVRGLRDQLHQGRAMLHQMMMLLHLEMQLRQQALVSYSHATDPETRLARLDEVLALNEQLNEVGGILSALLSNPINRESNRGSETGGLTRSRAIRHLDPQGTEESPRQSGGINAGNVHIIQTGSHDDSEAIANNIITPETNDDETSDSESSASTQYGIINRYSRASEGRSVTTSSGSTLQRRNSASGTSQSQERQNQGRGQQGIVSDRGSRNENRDGVRLLDRRSSSQRPTLISQSSISAERDQNVNGDTEESPGFQAAVNRSTTLPPISSGVVSLRTTSELPASRTGSGAYANVEQSLSSSRNNSSFVPNGNANSLSVSGGRPRLISEQSSRTITIDATQTLNQDSSHSRRQTPIQNGSAVETNTEATEPVPNSVVRQSFPGDEQSANRPVRATCAPQRRFSRQNSVVLNSDVSPNESSVQRRTSDGGARMTGVTTRRTSISRTRQNPTNLQTMRSNNRSHLPSRTFDSNRPLLNTRNSGDADNSARQPTESITNEISSDIRSRSRSTSDASGRSVLSRNTNNVSGNRTERLDRARRRSEIAQQLMGDTSSNNRN